MALTPEQEAKVLQIITAFDNGKRLNELPHIGEVNPRRGYAHGRREQTS